MRSYKVDIKIPYEEDREKVLAEVRTAIEAVLDEFGFPRDFQLDGIEDAESGELFRARLSSVDFETAEEIALRVQVIRGVLMTTFDPDL